MIGDKQTYEKLYKHINRLESDHMKLIRGKKFYTRHDYKKIMQQRKKIRVFLIQIKRGRGHLVILKSCGTTPWTTTL